MWICSEKEKEKGRARVRDGSIVVNLAISRENARNQKDLERQEKVGIRKEKEKDLIVPAGKDMRKVVRQVGKDSSSKGRRIQIPTGGATKECVGIVER